MSDYQIEARHYYHPRYWPLWLLFGIAWCVARMPFPVLLFLGKVLGRIVKWISAERRHVTRRNLQLCFPDLSEQELQQRFDDSFDNLGMGFIEIALAYWGTEKRVTSLAHFAGLEHVKQIQQQGQGVMIMAAHMTSLELCLRMFSARLKADGSPVAAMYKPAHNDLFEQYSSLKRARFCIPVPNKKVRVFFQHLRKGGAALYLPDQHYGAKNSVVAPFFGIPTATIAKTPEFVKLTGAAVAPVLFGRKKDGYHIEVMPALDLPLEDSIATATEINRWMETNIRMYPAQYLWQHRRFKHKPDGHTSYYD